MFILLENLTEAFTSGVTFAISYFIPFASSGLCSHDWEEAEKSTAGQFFYVCVIHEVYDIIASIHKRCIFSGKIALLVS